MRITPELLLKLANDFVAQRSKTDRGIIAVFLHGSLLREHPTLGGTTDIDLFILHADSFHQEREFVRITDEIHLDVSHHLVSQFRRPKELRADPWFGSAIEGCKILYDPQHLLDFIQASVRGQFNRPDHVLSRARPQAEQARQIWFGFQERKPEGSPGDIASYLRALEQAANAVACLTGPPLTERRFLLDFPERAAAVKHPGLSAGLLGLLGAPQVDGTKLRSWLGEWRAVYEAGAATQSPQIRRIHALRLNYYLSAFNSLMESERYLVVLWPLWRTWTHAVEVLASEADYRHAWQSVGEHLEMVGESFQRRLAALDAYLDLIDETLETWARENGA